ncbi:MAG: hypothetical protein QHH75_09940 [Bacillota bacterium]|nr:hypothetical protein [Bacillota bacterium]
MEKSKYTKYRKNLITAAVVMIWIVLLIAVGSQSVPRVYPYFALSFSISFMSLIICQHIRARDNFFRGLAAGGLSSIIAAIQAFLIGVVFRAVPDLGVHDYQTAMIVIQTVFVVGAVGFALFFIYNIKHPPGEAILLVIFLVLSLSGMASAVTGHPEFDPWGRKPDIIFRKQVATDGFSLPLRHGSRLYFVGSASSGPRLFCLDMERGKLLWFLELEIPPGADRKEVRSYSHEAMLQLRPGNIVRVAYEISRAGPDRTLAGYVTADVDVRQRRVLSLKEHEGELNVQQTTYAKGFKFQDITVQYGEYDGVRITGPNINALVLSKGYPYWFYCYKKNIIYTTSFGYLCLVSDNRFDFPPGSYKK